MPKLDLCTSVAVCAVAACAVAVCALASWPGSVGAQPPSGAQHSSGPGEHHGEPGHHHDFSDAERWAKVFDAAARDVWQKPAHVVTLLNLVPGMTVADLGAGTGYFIPYLSRAVGPQGKVLGLDVEATMVDYLRARASREQLVNVEARQVAADDPGLAPGTVDRVLIVDTWHHLDARPRYAAKLVSALAPEGAVVVVDFTRDSPHGPPPEFRLTAEQIAAELKAGGLVTEVLGEELPYQFVVIGRRPDGR